MLRTRVSVSAPAAGAPRDARVTLARGRVVIPRASLRAAAWRASLQTTLQQALGRKLEDAGIGLQRLTLPFDASTEPGARWTASATTHAHAPLDVVVTVRRRLRGGRVLIYAAIQGRRP